MTEDLLSHHRHPMPDVVASHSEWKLQPTTTIALVVLFALAVIAVSIGIAQAETLGTMVADETGRLALFGLVCVVVMTGGITAVGMWLTAPSQAYEEARKRLPALAHVPAKARPGLDPGWTPVRRQEDAPLHDL
jgi:hypothetical protein